MLSPRSRAARTLLCLAVLHLFALSSWGAGAEEVTRPITPHDLATLVDLDALAVSPDGRWAAVQTRQADLHANGYTQEWRLVAIAGGNHRRLVNAGDPIQVAGFGRVGGFILAPPPVWSPDSRWIVYLRKDGGRTQIWRARVDGGRAEQLTRGDADARALVFSRDGKRLLYETEPSAAQIAARLAEEGRSGFRYDNRFFPAYSRSPVLPADIDLTSLKKPFTSSQAEQRRVHVYDFSDRRARAGNDTELAEFDTLVRGRTPQGRDAYREPTARSRSGALAWSEARDPERQGAYAPLTIVAQPTAAEPILCPADECTSQFLRGIWWRGEKEVVFARREGRTLQDTALYSWRPAEGTARLVLRTPNLFASRGEWSCSVAGDQLVCFYEEPARPRRLVAINLDDGSINTLYDPNPVFALLDLGPAPQRIEFVSSSGVWNYGYLSLPPRRRVGERLSLVIVTYRCGGFLRGGEGDEYPAFAFSAEGHAVLCFNVPNTDFDRLATMDARAYESWSRGEGEPAKRRVQEALETAVDRLDRMGVIDPSRVGVTGLSLGAETTSYALWHMPRLGAAIASSAGYEPANTFLYGPAGRDLLRAWGLGDPDSPRWNHLALSRNAHKARAPLLLHVADHEMISALQPLAALEDAGRAVEMYVFPNEYHVKSQPVHRLAIYNRNIDWMNFWLQGSENTDPTKAGQYKRWRAMRAKQCEVFKGDDAPWYCRPGTIPQRSSQ